MLLNPFRFGGELPPLGCAYPLDATLEELLAAGVHGKLIMTDADQTGTYLLQGGLAAPEFYGAMPAGATTATAEMLDFSTGKKAIQVALAVPTITGGAGTMKAEAMAQFLDAGFAFVVSAALQALDDGTFALSISTGAGEGFTPWYTGAAASSSLAVTLEFDATSGKIAARADGVPLVLSADAYTPAPLFVLAQAREEPAIAGGFAGDAVSIALRSNAAEMTGVISTGFTDACGNPI